MVKSLTLILMAAASVLAVGARARAAELKPHCLTAYSAIRADDDGQDRMIDAFEHGKVIRSAIPMPVRRAIRG